MHLIKKYTLSALEDNLLSPTKRVEDEATTVPNKRGEDFSLSLQLNPQLVEVDVRFTLKDVLQEFVLLFHMGANPLAHAMRGEEIRAPNPGSLTAVLVCWTNSSTSRSDLTCAPSELPRFVD
jgi:hypothetical protein